VSINYAFEMGFQKYSNLFDQIHEISISYSLSKKKTIPVDTISNPDFPLIVKNDSLKPDTSIKIITTKKDTARVNLVNIADSLKTDTLTPGLVDKSHKDSNLDNYEIIKVGDGIYSVKYKIEPGDSIQYSVNQDTSLNNNSQVADELMNRIIREKLEKTDSTDNSRKGFYTIRLYLDESNKNILRDAEIALETWFDADDQGKFMYYLGRYKTMEEAKNRLLALKKYESLVSEIIRIDK
jgi:hypothetical protein